IRFSSSLTASTLPQLRSSPPVSCVVRTPLLKHSIAQPTVQEDSLQSIPRRSTSRVSMTVAPRSVLPIIGPQAAICSYSGSSPAKPAQDPSVTLTSLTCARPHFQQGLDLI